MVTLDGHTLFDSFHCEQTNHFSNFWAEIYLEHRMYIKPFLVMLNQITRHSPFGTEEFKVG